MENKEQELDFCLLIPCYNNKAGLMHSLTSVKYPPNRFLVLVVDDGSAEPINEKEISNQLPVCRSSMSFQKRHRGKYKKSISVMIIGNLRGKQADSLIEAR